MMFLFQIANYPVDGFQQNPKVLLLSLFGGSDSVLAFWKKKEKKIQEVRYII